MRYAALLMLLAGCASTLPTEVRIPVPVSCVETMPASPAFAPDAALLALDDGAFVVALGIDRQERILYISVLEAVLMACVK